MPVACRMVSGEQHFVPNRQQIIDALVELFVRYLDVFCLWVLWWLCLGSGLVGVGGGGGGGRAEKEWRGVHVGRVEKDDENGVRCVSERHVSLFGPSFSVLLCFVRLCVRVLVWVCVTAAGRMLCWGSGWKVMVDGYGSGAGE